LHNGKELGIFSERNFIVYLFLQKKRSWEYSLRGIFFLTPGERKSRISFCRRAKGERNKK
jgi:hypothetical protein